MEAERLLERVGQRLLVAALDPDQRTQGDPHGQATRPAVELKRLTGHQPRHLRRALGNHRVAHRDHLLGMKGGHQDVSGVAVKRTIDVEQTVAEQWPQVHKAPLPPRERLELADQDLMVGCRADRPHVRLGAMADGEDRAVAAAMLEQQPERIGEGPTENVHAEAVGAGGQAPTPARPQLGPGVGHERRHDPNFRRRGSGRGDDPAAGGGLAGARHSGGAWRSRNRIAPRVSWGWITSPRRVTSSSPSSVS